MMTEPTNTEQVEFVVLDMLADGELPFLEIYRTLQGSEHLRETDFGDLLHILHQMKHRGWLHEWLMDENGETSELADSQHSQVPLAYQSPLPLSDTGRMPRDRVGLWFEITDEGRSTWRSRLPPVYQSPPLWSLLLDLRDRTVTIHADSMETAEKALAEWLKAHQQVRIDRSSKSIERINSFKLHDERLIRDGVKVVYRVQAVGE